MSRRHNERGAVRVAAVMVAAMVAALAACGGKSDGGGVDEPAPQTDESQENVAMVPEHRWVEIEHLFERRRPMISRCFSEAIDAGELTDDDRGYITVGLTITASGRAADLKILEATLDSQHLHDCALEHVGEWEFGTLPRDVEYSFSYQLETL